MNNFFKKNNSRVSFKRGYTLVEALIYIAIFIIMSSIIVSLILSILETNRQVLPINSLSNNATSALEIMIKEIRAAVGINVANSVFSDSNGVLDLNTLDADGRPREAKFYLDSGTLKFDEGGIYLGPLTASDVLVTSATFDLATSTNESLIKIELDLTSGISKYEKSEKFYSSIKLRTSN